MAEPDPTPPTLTQTPEILRITFGGSLVISSIVGLIVCLYIILQHVYINTVSEGVAILGTITTFLGGVIGVFFGISAGSTAHAQTALAATQANAAAGKAADAASAAMGAANDSNNALSQATAATSSAGDALQNALASFRSMPGSSAAAAPDAAPTMAAGDPEEALAVLALPQSHAAVVDALASVERLESSAPAATVFGIDLIRVAGKEADDGVSRTSDQARVSEYLKLLGLTFLDSHGVPTRYCAAGITWAACGAYCDANTIAYDDSSRLAVFRSVLGNIRRSFKPSASCPDIMTDAKRRGLWLSNTADPQAGYLVLYNWNSRSDAQHIGIVESRAAGELHTIEFNTTATDAGTGQSNGGAVARKTRDLKFVLGYVKTY